VEGKMPKEWSEFIQMAKLRNEKYPKQFAWNADTQIAFLKSIDAMGHKEVLATVHKPHAGDDFWEAEIEKTEKTMEATIKKESLSELMSEVETLTIRKMLK
jgi:hypothetical protein